jgi:hypothetical protein
VKFCVRLWNGTICFFFSLINFFLLFILELIYLNNKYIDTVAISSISSFVKSLIQHACDIWSRGGA